MNRKVTLYGGLALVGVIVLGAAAVWYAFLRPTEAASAPIESVPLQVEESSVSAAADEGAVEAVDEADAASVAAGLQVFRIVPGESEARFAIGETLRGERITAVGVTNQVAAEIGFDIDNPAAAQVGPVLINARTIATDESRRNRAIGNFILNTSQYEFIEFAPTAITGLPDSVTIGEPVVFQVTGDLTIRDVTREVTFELTVQPTSATELQGLGQTTVLRSDFNLTIPRVPQVADVDDEVVLEIEFVARAEAS